MDVEERIFDKLDMIGNNISDLCNRITKLELDYKNHLDGLQESHDKKLRNRDYYIVLFGLGIAGIELLRSLGMI